MNYFWLSPNTTKSIQHNLHTKPVILPTTFSIYSGVNNAITGGSFSPLFWFITVSTMAIWTVWPHSLFSNAKGWHVPRTSEPRKPHYQINWDRKGADANRGHNKKKIKIKPHYCKFTSDISLVVINWLPQPLRGYCFIGSNKRQGFQRPMQ